MTRRHAFALAAGAVAAVVIPATAVASPATASDPEPECVADLMGGS
ncbi:hypothetical protein AB0I28_13770 [Phytomonospora sp. NPDC050363]